MFTTAVRTARRRRPQLCAVARPGLAAVAAVAAPSSRLEADTLLVSAAALWGTYPTCVKLLFAAGPQLDPSIVVLVRS